MALVAVSPVTTAAPTIHDGFYTVSLIGRSVTFRIASQPQDASFAPGKQIIGFLRGSDNTRDYASFAFVIDGRLAVWTRFRQGYTTILEAARFLIEDRGTQQAAGRMYAQQSGNCYICNRLLTTSESVSLGIGPTCAGRL